MNESLSYTQKKHLEEIVRKRKIVEKVKRILFWVFLGVISVFFWHKSVFLFAFIPLVFSAYIRFSLDPFPNLRVFLEEKLGQYIQKNHNQKASVSLNHIRGNLQKYKNILADIFSAFLF